MRECSQCGSVNQSQSEITKKLRDANSMNDKQNQLTAENLLHLEEGTKPKPGPIDEEAASIRSVETTMSVASSDVSDKFTQIHASAPKLTAKSAEHTKRNKSKAVRDGKP